MQEPRPDEPTHLRSWPPKSMSMYVNVYVYIYMGILEPMYMLNHKLKMIYL